VADFKELRVWRHAHALALNAAKTARKITAADCSRLRRQMIRAALSVSANIVEGREKDSEPEFARFLEIAKGSVSELEEHLIIARDLDLISTSDFHSLNDQIENVQKMLSGLLTRVRRSIESKRDKRKPRPEVRVAGSD
jgi:four helix bundle protein